MTVDIDTLVQQFKDTLDVARADLMEQEAALSVKRQSVQALERAYQALAGKKPAKKARGEVAPRVPGGLRVKIEEALNASNTAMDLGALARTIFGVDDARHRTRISAAVSPVTSDPNGSIRRVGVGSYTSRQTE